MIIGVPKEIKPQENRVGLVPSGVRELVHHGHRILVETNAGEGIGCTDQDYTECGARIISTAAEVFAKADMIVKVKEPQEPELKLLRPDQILFTYLHLAPDPEQAKGLINSGCIAVAYETVTCETGGLPLLAPMSEVAGRLSIQAGAHALERQNGGSGILLSGVPGVGSGNVMIIGGGVAGTNAAKVALGIGAKVAIFDRSLLRLRELDDLFEQKVQTIYSTLYNIENYIKKADLVIGSVLIPGKSAPKLVSKEMLMTMKKGSVLLDIAIDQGGCFETSHPTTHLEPTYTVEGIVHYCVANMPAAVARTSAFALNNATLPYVSAFASKGVTTALKEDAHLRNGLNVYKGKITHKSVAEDLGYTFTDPMDVL